MPPLLRPGRFVHSDKKHRLASSGQAPTTLPTESASERGCEPQGRVARQATPDAKDSGNWPFHFFLTGFPPCNAYFFIATMA
jgi:hypothetical protein